MKKSGVSVGRCRFVRVTGAVLVLAVMAAQGGGIHRWVDAEGNVHFGDRPPAGVKAETVRVPETGGGAAGTKPQTEAERARRRQRLLRAFEEERRLERQQAAEAERRAAQRRRACAAARDRLRSLRQASGIYRLDEQGRRVFLDRRERAAAEASAQADVARYCGE